MLPDYDLNITTNVIGETLINLNLSFNKIVSIEMIVKILKQLELLDISNNDLSLIDDNIANLINLQILNLSHNLIISLPKGLSFCKMINTINLKNNKLNTVPFILSYLKKLNYLDISYNFIDNSNISEMTSAFYGMKILEFLDLSQYDNQSTRGLLHYEEFDFSQFIS